MNKAYLKYIFSTCFLFISFAILAQEQMQQNQEEEKEPLHFYGVKAGINIGRFTDFIFKPERFSMEGSVDFNFGHKYFAVAEGGYSITNFEKENYNYSSEGYFIKLGFDYNMLKKYPTDFLGVGVRVGRSSFSQDANNVTIVDNHWGNIPINIPSEKINAYWLEGSLGLKAEILKNIYLGWDASIKIILSGGNPGFNPYNIPGYGNGISTINLGANYYIYYQIPYNRKK
ncbi:MAG TPA: DUF6048 family protein [Bacteroidales bacterium]|nr:DUF6048 family protein [Bacteroidales bacterium]